jgi:hypothetical protein
MGSECSLKLLNAHMFERYAYAEQNRPTRFAVRLVDCLATP